MWLEAFLRKIGPSFETNELLWLRGNMFKNDTEKFVGEVEDTHRDVINTIQGPKEADGGVQSRISLMTRVSGSDPRTKKTLSEEGTARHEVHVAGYLAIAAVKSTQVSVQ